MRRMRCRRTGSETEVARSWHRYHCEVFDANRISEPGQPFKLRSSRGVTNDEDESTAAVPRSQSVAADFAGRLSIQSGESGGPPRHRDVGEVAALSRSGSCCPHRGPRLPVSRSRARLPVVRRRDVAAGPRSAGVAHRNRDQPVARHGTATQGPPTTPGQSRPHWRSAFSGRGSRTNTPP